MKKIYVFLAFLLPLVNTASAQFSGSYAPANWTTVTPPPSNGNVNTTSAPASIVITGSNAATQTNNVDVDYTITTVSAGSWSFSWAYHTNDTDSDPTWDIAGVLINGTFTQLSNNTGGINQSGTYNGASVPAGTVIGFRVRAVDNLMGTATLTISNFSAPNLTLPVSLTNFTATTTNQSVKLDWATEKEENSNYFDVQHSVNGKDFLTIATVKAQTNSGTTQPYSSVHASPSAGTNYYRLRMTDIDGSFKYSKIVSAKLEAVISATVFPNPVVDQLNVIYNAVSASKESFQLYTADGQFIKAVYVNLMPGVNTIQINTSGFSKGVYLLKTNQANSVIRFVKK